MNRYLEQFNKLKPFERRFLIFVGVMLFLVFNYFFVWSHFGELDAANRRKLKAEADIRKFRAEIANKATYEAAINRFVGSENEVPADDQAIHFDRYWHERATENRVSIPFSGRPTVHTNEFFLEQEVGATIQAEEKNLVSFLYSLGSGGSMARVRNVSLHPDQTHMQLSANVTIVASYQKSQPAARTVAPARTEAAAAAPAPQPKPAAKPQPASQPPATPPKLQPTPARMPPPGKLIPTNRPPVSLKTKRS